MRDGAGAAGEGAMDAQARIRVLIARPGPGAHDGGVTVMARALRDAGMEVVYAGWRQTPEMIVSAAIQEDVAAIGLSCPSGNDLHLVPRVMDALRAHGAADIVVFGGGTVADEDIPGLKACGLAEVFTRRAGLHEAVAFLRSHTSRGGGRRSAGPAAAGAMEERQ
jgi:methylmalonyl-CoA mutase C-terminal domain/subunit